MPPSASWLGIPAQGWAVLALAFWAAKAAQSLRQGEPENLLWACNLGVLLLVPALLFSWPTLNAVILLWLALGLPFWLLDLAGGAPFLCSSIGTHVGGFLAAVAGARLMGMPQGAWWKAFAALLVLQQACRWVTPRGKNVNISFSVWPGWERVFPSYAVYWAVLAVVSATAFLLSERLMLRWRA